MTLTLENRKPIWKTLSKLYIDTELQDFDYTTISTVLLKSNKNIKQLKKIDTYEVFPVLKTNMFNPFPLGALEEFDTEWLNKKCTETYLKKKNLFFRIKTKAYLFIIGNNDDHWVKIENKMNVLKKINDKKQQHTK